MTSILVITLSWTYLCLCRVHRIYPCAVIRVSEFQKKNLGKQKIGQATIVAIFRDNCSKTLRPNLNGEHFEKINIKTAVAYDNIFLCQITVYLENSRLWNQIWSKEIMITILRNRRCINTIIICSIIASNSCNKFHVIWRIINFLSKFAQKLL